MISLPFLWVHAVNELKSLKIFDKSIKTIYNYKDIKVSFR